MLCRNGEYHLNTSSIAPGKRGLRMAEKVDPKAAVQWFDDWGLTPETATQVLMNYSAFLSSQTGGKLSKIGYDVKTMESVADDYAELQCSMCDYYKTATEKG